MLHILDDSEEKVGIVIGEKVIPINEIFNVIGKNFVTSMNQLIENFDGTTIEEIEAAVSNNNFNSVPLDSIKLLAPIPNPKEMYFALVKIMWIM